MATALQTKKAILQKQLYKLAKLYTSKPVTVANIEFHNRVLKKEVEVIKELKALRKK